MNVTFFVAATVIASVASVYCALVPQKLRLGANKKRRTFQHAAIVFPCLIIQYFGTFGSTSFDQPVIPPARFHTFLNPICARSSAAFWLRPPDLQ
jgi:hypothetical protein